MAKGLRPKIFGSRLYNISLGNQVASPESVPPALWPMPVTYNLQEHSFEWLCNLSASEQPLEASAARERIQIWLKDNNQWHAETWRADHLGDRLTFGLTYFDALCDNAPSDFKSEFAAALNRQARHLFRLPTCDRTEVDTFRYWRGAIIAALHLSAFQRRLPGAIQGLLKEISMQVFPDGGHLARNPQTHLETLAALIHIRAALAHAQSEVPEILQNTIDRMAPMLRAYRHGDGGLGLFNGSQHGDPAVIERVLALSESRAKPASSAPHTGFHRISAKRTTVLLDAAPPADTAPLGHGHAGTLSFEISVGAHRMIVNCGSVPGLGGADLTEALRATAAHSTLTIADIHSSDLVPNAGFGERRARNVTARRREQDRNVLVETQHDGYAEPFGLIHRRSLYLDRDGLDLRGEDILEAAKSTGHVFCIRFHLHPSVQASLVGGGRSVIIRLPTGRGWRLSVSDGALDLTESIYAGDGAPRQTTQIVITGRHSRRQTITKWRLAREG
jgi:uncharacterized heparinase superfamily protein